MTTLGLKTTAIAALVTAASMLAGCQSSSTDSGASASATAERPATRTEIEGVAVGRTVNNAMTYQTDGTYLYQGRNPGQYRISSGQICVNFESGGRRCDRIVTADDGETFTMINSDGRRFPFG